MSIARHHSEWLSLIEVSGPFLSIPVLMRVFPQGLENHDPEKFRTLRLAYEEWEENNDAGPRTNPAIREAWIKFVLTTVLGIPDESILEQQAIPQTLQASVAEHGEFLRPSHVIQDQRTHKALLLIQSYPPNQDLDKPVIGRTWKASPGTRMMGLLHATGVRLGLVTNGERWMLVDAPKNETTGFASWYASIWLEEPITLRAFTSLLGADRFFNAAPTNTFEAMLAESASNQQEVTDQLGYQVRRAVEVLIQSLDRADQDHDRSLLASIPEPVLYEAALTVMMRLVFLFSAEERGLLLLNDELYARNYAVSTLREQLRKTADDHGEEILERRHDAWCRLLSTFRAVYGGVRHDRLTLPAYGGHLFDPDRFRFLEGRKPGTTWKTCEADPLPVNNRTVLHLLEALQMLEVRMPSGEKAARRVSFRALDIEQIGHVYEGLLDHTAKRATELMLGLLGTRDREPEVPLSKLESIKAEGEGKLIEFLREETGKSASALRKALAEQIDLHNASRFQAVCGSDTALLKRIGPFAGLVRDDTFGYPVVITDGSVFVTAGTDRRSSGTHYTPRSLTEPIVQYTLEPLVYFGPAEGKSKEEWQLRPAKALLDLKICDMACGSGAFLVQACRYLSERLVEAWEVAEKSHPSPNPGKLPFPTITPEGNPATGRSGEALIPKDAAERLAYARRIIAQRCLYGVDVNPLAAEMAKLSLWLLTLAKDKPFTFLDHAIRCGDSLLGIRAVAQIKTFGLDGRGQQYVFGELPLDELVSSAIRDRQVIERMQSDTAQDIQAQEGMLTRVESETLKLQCIADFLLAAEYGSGGEESRLESRDLAAIELGARLVGTAIPDLARDALGRLGRRRFHWAVEFPEVFDLIRGGFDAIIGNPPFLGGARISGTYGDDYLRYLLLTNTDSNGNADLCSFFLRRAGALLRVGGGIGLVTTNSIYQGATHDNGLYPLVESGFSINRATRSSPWPGSANVFISVVFIRRGEWKGRCILDDHNVPRITSTFEAGDGMGAPLRLQQNIGVVFRGATVGGEGFILSPEERDELIGKDPRCAEVIKPFLTGFDILNDPSHLASRYAIDLGDMDETSARAYGPIWDRLYDTVRLQRKGNKIKYRETYWWRYIGRQEKMYAAIAGLDKIIVSAEVTKYWVATLVNSEQVFSGPVVLFALSGFPFLGLLNSCFHHEWAEKTSSRLKDDPRFSLEKNTETFPIPSVILESARRAVKNRTSTTLLEIACESFHRRRGAVLAGRRIGLTAAYNLVHRRDVLDPEIAELRDLQVGLDGSIASAYGWDDVDLGHGFFETRLGTRFTINEPARREILGRLLKLNHERYAEEVAQGLHAGGSKTKRRNAGNGVAGAAATLFGDSG